MIDTTLFNLEPMSVRCGYCAGCDHLTFECPGLRHDNASTRAFLRRKFPPSSYMTEVYVEPRRCWKCKQPEHSGRKLVNSKRMRSIDELLCGDCMAFTGVPLEKQSLPSPEPEPINYHAWQTPAYDGVG